MLDAIAGSLELDEPPAHPLETLLEGLALESAGIGYDVPEVVAEYELLRHTIFERYFATAAVEPPPRFDTRGIVRASDAIDQAVLDALGQYVEARDRARDLSVGMAHDLRAPLQAILSSADELRADGGGGTPSGSLARIRSSALRIGQMIEDLLEFTQAPIGSGLPISRVDADLGAVVDGIVDEFAIDNPDRRIAWRKGDPAGDFRGAWDPHRIAQVVWHLLANAVQHGADPIVVELFDEGDLVRLDVRNQGTIHDSVRARMFAPFVAGPAASGASAGLGLGLYIVAELVHAHGGAIGVDSSARAGTVFSVRLPRRPAEEPAASR